MQETLLSLRRDLVRYRRMTDAEAGAWLRAMAIHRACDLKKDEMSRHHREQRIRQEATPCKDLEAEGADLEEQQQRLIKAMASLSPQQCAILRLHFVEGQNYHDIARGLGISPASAQRQGHRALKRLRSLLRSAEDRKVGFLGLLVVLSDGRRLPAVPSPGPAAVAGAVGGVWTKVLVLSLLLSAATGLAVSVGLCVTADSSPIPSARQPPEAASAIAPRADLDSADAGSPRITGAISSYIDKDGQPVIQANIKCYGFKNLRSVQVYADGVLVVTTTLKSFGIPNKVYADGTAIVRGDAPLAIEVIVIDQDGTRRTRTGTLSRGTSRLEPGLLRF